MENTSTTAPETLFAVSNGSDLSWEGFMCSKEDVEALFPNGQITEFRSTEWDGIYEA